jgi:hypothetical protein
MEPPLDVENGSTRITLSLDSNVPGEDMYALFRQLRKVGKHVTAEPLGAGPSLGDIVIWITLFTTSVQAAKDLTNIGEVLKRWTVKMRRKGIDPHTRVTDLLGEGVTVEIVEINGTVEFVAYTPPPEPKCPDCNIVGLQYIVARPNIDTPSGAASGVVFEVVFCDHCGHVYGVLPGHGVTDRRVPPI